MINLLEIYEKVYVQVLNKDKTLICISYNTPTDVRHMITQITWGKSLWFNGEVHLASCFIREIQNKSFPKAS